MAHAKQDRDFDPGRMKLVKSPKDSQGLRPNITIKVKKETEGPPIKNLLVKKPLETSVKVSAFVKTVMVRNEVEGVKVVKKETHALNKEKATQMIGKVQTVKRAEVPISRGNAASSNVSTKKKKGSKEESEKKEKKVYDLPGQKHDSPEERDPLRIFYESLYQQNPKSEMAEVWMMEHGLLSTEAAKKAFERKKKTQLSQKMGSPLKTPSKNVMVKIEKKKSPTLNGDTKFSKPKRELDSDDNDDFILKPRKKLKSTA